MTFQQLENKHFDSSLDIGELWQILMQMTDDRRKLSVDAETFDLNLFEHDHPPLVWSMVVLESQIQSPVLTGLYFWTITWLSGFDGGKETSPRGVEGSSTTIMINSSPMRQDSIWEAVHESGVSGLDIHI